MQITTIGRGAPGCNWFCCCALCSHAEPKAAAYPSSHEGFWSFRAGNSSWSDIGRYHCLERRGGRCLPAFLRWAGGWDAGVERIRIWWVGKRARGL